MQARPGAARNVTMSICACCQNPPMPKAEFSSAVVVRHLPEQSDAQSGQHAFAYTVTIKNTGDVTAQLIARHWVISDAAGHTEEVRGLAVVGHQPLLKPGESFEYTSWTRLATPNGTMRGTFFCMTEDATPFDAPVPEFSLSLASTLH
jgi:ApaG protein